MCRPCFSLLFFFFASYIYIYIYMYLSIERRALDFLQCADDTTDENRKLKKRENVRKMSLLV